MIPLRNPSLTADDLPTTPYQPYGDWVLVLVEPAGTISGLELVQRLDQHGEVGVGYVVAASPERYVKYQEVLPKDLQKHDIKFTEPKYFVRDTEVRRGDVVLFRRFLRTQGRFQPEIPLEYPNEKGEGYEYFCIHVDDIIGVRGKG